MNCYGLIFTFFSSILGKVKVIEREVDVGGEFGSEQRLVVETFQMDDQHFGKLLDRKTLGAFPPLFTSGARLGIESIMRMRSITFTRNVCGCIS